MTAPVLIPHSTEAESAVLGAILIDDDAIFEVGNLEPDDFFIVRHAWIWEAMGALRDRKIKIDYLTLAEELEQRGKLAEIGGAAYLLHLVNETPHGSNAEGHAAVITDRAMRRRLLDAAQDIARHAQSEDTDINSVVENSETALQQATARQDIATITTIHDIAAADFDRVQHRSRHPADLSGIPTGHSDIDRMTGGLFETDLIVIAGRTGMGKTSLMHNWMMAQAAAGIPVGLFSLEMSARQVGWRFIARASCIPTQTIKDGIIRDTQWPAYVTSMETLSRYVVPIDDRAAITPLAMRTAARKMIHEYGARVIYVDYLQLMSGGSAFRGKDNRVSEVSYISRELKNMAKDLKVPVVAGAQLSRACEMRQNKRPILSDLRESGSIEQDADVVMFIYRDGYYDPETLYGNRAEIHIAKHRNGPTGVVDLTWLPETTSFVNAARVDND